MGPQSKPGAASSARPAATKAAQGKVPAPAPNHKVDGKTAEEWKAVGNEAVKTDHAAAYEAYSKGLQADPNHAMILSNRAMCLEKLGRLEEALADATRCTALRPDFVKAFLRASDILEKLERPQEALEILRRAPT